MLLGRRGRVALLTSAIGGGSAARAPMRQGAPNFCGYANFCGISELVRVVHHGCAREIPMSVRSALHVAPPLVALESGRTSTRGFVGTVPMSGAFVTPSIRLEKPLAR